MKSAGVQLSLCVSVHHKAHNAGSAHLAGELFKSMAKVNLTTVPYKGAAPAITDLLGGQIQVMFTTVARAGSLISAGYVRGEEERWRKVIQGANIRIE
jgi:tripartite-type tricarboxylate transporter receptor subunit TctC